MFSSYTCNSCTCFFVTRPTKTFCQITESEADALGRPLCPEASPEDWLRAVEDCALEPSITVTIGAPSTGKSTFVRRLLNRYLTGQGKSARSVPAVCYLDLDPAKPEYTPHGQVSLSVIRTLNLGPNFTHPTTEPSSSFNSKTNAIIRAHSMPSNLANYAHHYRACAEDLFLAYKTLQAQDPLIPLVINTPGSVYTSDFDLLTSLISRFKPHHTVHLGDIHSIDTDHATRLHTLQTAVSQYRGTFHELAAHVQTPVVPQRTDTELRAMQMQSYFHLTTTNNRNSQTPTPTWSQTPLSHLVPWEFTYDSTPERLQSFIGFLPYSEPTEPSSLHASLNGALIHIVESTSSAIPSPYTDLPRTKNHRLPYFPSSEQTGMFEPLDPRSSKVICTALIRGFDVDRKVVQVLVPKMYESALYRLVPDRTVFVGGCCETPEWAYVEDVYGARKGVGARDGMVGELGGIPWVEDRARMDGMGYLNTVRRVRKFQT
jgi:polynucleotide 5'-hydroxyl-kinase GRC3/NOL9